MFLAKISKLLKRSKDSMNLIFCEFQPPVHFFLQSDTLFSSACGGTRIHTRTHTHTHTHSQQTHTHIHTHTRTLSWYVRLGAIYLPLVVLRAHQILNCLLDSAQGLTGYPFNLNLNQIILIKNFRVVTHGMDPVQLINATTLAPYHFWSKKKLVPPTQKNFHWGYRE